MPPDLAICLGCSRCDGSRRDSAPVGSQPTDSPAGVSRRPTPCLCPRRGFGGLSLLAHSNARRLAARALALGKQAFVRPLVVGLPRESLHDAKHDGCDTSGIRLGFRYRNPMLDAREIATLRSIGCEVVVVDNVVDTGRTARERAAVLGDVSVAAIACTGRHLEK